MTRDEQRQAWRVYAAALVAVLRWPINDMADVGQWADALMEEERKRFDSPDHSADSGKMVEPREWVGLTDEDVSILASWLFGDGRANVELLLRRVDDLLREKNGGTR